MSYREACQEIPEDAVPMTPAEWQAYQAELAAPPEERPCAVCGYFDGEHNPEAHTAGRRAEANAYWEPPERDDDERDYGPADDAVCARCGQVGVDWNLEVDAARDLELPYVEKAGAAYEAEGVVWATVCTECERPADWPVNPDLRAC